MPDAAGLILDCAIIVVDENLVPGIGDAPDRN